MQIFSYILLFYTKVTPYIDKKLNLIPNKFQSNCNTQTDLNDKNVLLSFDFYFFFWKSKYLDI